MHIHTIEENYDYRIANVVRALLSDFGDAATVPQNGEALMDWLFQHAEWFGKAIVEDMVNFMDENDWLDEVK
jgi:hypothetical protein